MQGTPTAARLQEPHALTGWQVTKCTATLWWERTNATLVFPHRMHACKGTRGFGWTCGERAQGFATPCLPQTDGAGCHFIACRSGNPELLARTAERCGLPAQSALPLGQASRPSKRPGAVLRVSRTAYLLQGWHRAVEDETLEK